MADMELALPEIQVDCPIDEDQADDDLFDDRTPIVSRPNYRLSKGLLGVLDADFSSLIGRKASSSTPYVSRSLSCAPGSTSSTVSPASDVFTPPSLCMNLTQSLNNASYPRLTKHKPSDDTASALFTACDVALKKPRSSDASQDSCDIVSDGGFRRPRCLDQPKLFIQDSLVEQESCADSGFGDGSDLTLSLCSHASHEQSYCDATFQHYRSRSIESLNSIGSDAVYSDYSNNTFSETSSVTSETAAVDSLSLDLAVESGIDLSDSVISSSSSATSSPCICKSSSSSPSSCSSHSRVSQCTCSSSAAVHTSSVVAHTSQTPPQTALLPPQTPFIPRTLHRKHDGSLSQTGVTESPQVCSAVLASVLQHYSPPVTDRLIGRKMGLESFDIIGGLRTQNRDCLSSVLVYLSGADLCSMCLVSRTWRDVVKSNPAAAKCRKNHVRSFAVCSTQKENCGKLVDSLIRGLTSSNKTLSVVQRVEPPRLPAPTVIERELPDEPVVPHQRFWKEASKLRNDESLVKCPKCQKPAKKHDVQERGWCTHPSCAYDFCCKCRNPFHGGKACVTVKTSKTKTDSSVGSKKSKRALKRL